MACREQLCHNQCNVCANFVLSPYTKQALINMNRHKSSHWKIIPQLGIMKNQ
jgi:hypothetical protein